MKYILKPIADIVINSNFQNRSPLLSKSLATNALLNVVTVKCRYINNEVIDTNRINVLQDIIPITINITKDTI